MRDTSLSHISNQIADGERLAPRRIRAIVSRTRSNMSAVDARDDDRIFRRLEAPSLKVERLWNPANARLVLIVEIV
jgi:hypothetical protein